MTGQSTKTNPANKPIKKEKRWAKKTSIQKTVENKQNKNNQTPNI